MEIELKALAKELDIEKDIVMPGRIPHERIAGVYSMIDILCYPRYSMRLTELVTPLKPLEAMVMGKALIASDVGGHKELISDNVTGLLFEAGNLDRLTEKIEMLIKNRNLEEMLQKDSSTWVRRHHTWEATTKVYQNIYAKLILLC